MKHTSIIKCAAILFGLSVWSSATAQNPGPTASLKAARSIEVPAPSVKLQGVMVANNNWTDDSQAGVYTLEGKPGGKVSVLSRNPAMLNVAAAIVKDNVMYAVEAETAGFFYRSYSTTNWKGGTREEIDVQNVPSDLTYDAVTDKVYGGFWDVDYNGFSRFASFGLTTAEATDIKNPNRDERDIFAMAAAPDGKLYGLFGAYNYLAVFDPKTGQAERIGRTGLSIKANVARHIINSMCYDVANKRLLAAVYTEEGYGASKVAKSALYQIDPATAETTLLYTFDGDACFAGLYVVDDQPDATAPAAVRNLSVKMKEGSLTEGVVSFDMPSMSVGSAPLSGTLMAIITVNGVQSVIADLAPGAHAELAVTLKAGNNDIAVTPADATQRGLRTDISVWAGEDSPAAVSNVVLDCKPGAASLTWVAPAKGAKGGVIIPENLRYRITRYPGATVVADAATGNSFTDSSVDQSWKVLYYDVVAYNTQGEAPAVRSNKSPAAGALTVPFTEGFDTAADFDVWTVENVNGGSTWTYNSSKCAQYEYHAENLPGDDWLISPPIALEAGKRYKLSYSFRAYNKSYPESFEVFMGMDAKAAAMTQNLAVHKDFNNTVFQTAEQSFAPDATGKFYIGFHNNSAGKMWKMYLDDIKIELLDSRVPAAVSKLTVKAAAKGALQATISFTAPTKDSEGGNLVGLKNAVVTREGAAQPIATITDITPGKAVSITDNVPESGEYTYTVVCANEIGNSLAATAKAFVGVDAPGQVLNLMLDEQDRHPVLSWEAPDRGANGGYFDASNITYRILRSDGKCVADSTRETRFTDLSYTSPAASQDALWYLVTPYAGTVKGKYAQTELTLFGMPYSTPATETFANADMKFYPWMSQSDNAVYYAWTLETAGAKPATADQSGDRGLARFHSVGEPVGTVSNFSSPMFDISALPNPCVSFYMYHSPSIAGDATLQVMFDGGYGDGFEPMGTAIRRDAADADGWVRHVVEVPDYLRTQRFRVGFRATGDAVADIYLDKVSVESLVEIDASIVRCAAPARIAADVEADITVTVINSGTQSLSKARVLLLEGDAELASAVIPTLASGKESTVALPYTFTALGKHNVTAKLVLTESSAVYTSAFTVEAVAPVLAAPAAPTVAEGSNGSVLITWNAPEADGAVLDDIESYKAWAIDGVGQWTMFDGDYDLTYFINKDAGEYANATARKAFQVLDVARLGIDIWEEGKAHSGNKLLAAMAGVNYENNDWLISPRLNGAPQWISFYARSFTTQNTPAERMKVWYSTTDTDAANFLPLTENYVELPGTWREYRYFLPAGARYFAVNCVSNGSFAMFVDDLRFNDLTVPQWPVKSYEVYRDGIKIADTDATSYTDTPSGDKAEYAVKAVYDHPNAVSPLSEAARYQYSGIETPIAVQIEAYIAVDGSIYAPDAQLAPGIYLVRYNDGTTLKRIIR